MQSTMKNLSLYLVISTAIISGFSIFLNKYGLQDINPYIFTGLKNLIVGVILFLVIFSIQNIQGFLKETRKYAWQLFTVGIIGGSIPFILFFKGLTLTSSSQGSFIQKTMFLFTVILAYRFLKEKINLKLYIAGILVLIGNILALKFLPPYQFGTGYVLILAATIFWAIENVFVKYLLKNISATTIIFSRMFYGGVIVMLFTIFTNDFSKISSLSVNHWWWIYITSILLFGYVITWYNGLKGIQVSTATIILAFGSPVTTLLNYITTSKLPSNQILIGTLILVLAVAIVSVGSTKTKLNEN